MRKNVVTTIFFSECTSRVLDHNCVSFQLWVSALKVVISMSLLSISLLLPACVTFINSVWNGGALTTSKLAPEVFLSGSAGEATITSWGWESPWLASRDKLASSALVGGSGSDGGSSDGL